MGRQPSAHKAIWLRTISSPQYTQAIITRLSPICSWKNREAHGVSVSESNTSYPPSDAPIPTHAAYSDEAQYNFGRYRGLGLVTLPTAEAAPLSEELRALLTASGM